MTLPLGFKATGSNKGCQLQKSLYGLKQAPTKWFVKLSLKLLEYNFIRSYIDYHLLTYKEGDKFMAFLVYVDDLVIRGNDIILYAQFKAYLHAYFHIKDLGLLKYFLGIKVARKDKGLFLCEIIILLRLLTNVDCLGPSLLRFLWKRIIS